MPEGQVSHRNALRLTDALRGAPVVHVHAGAHVAAQRIPERLEGDVFTSVDAVGKHHVLHFASGRALHSHLGMNGRWRLLTADAPVPQSGLWLVLRTATHAVAQYNGPRLRLHEPGEQIPALRTVGPDLLSPERDPGDIAVSAVSRAEPSRAIGDTLLDQRLLSGLGNVYRAETLFLCGIDPWRASGQVSDGEARAIGTTGAALLAAGVRKPGPITTYSAPRSGSRERTWVYGRSGRPCRRCGTPIRAHGMGDANRTIYWCPTCQT